VSERESWGVREWQAEGTVDVHSEGVGELGSWGARGRGGEGEDTGGFKNGTSESRGVGELGS
jgi:hypothetical protein